MLSQSYYRFHKKICFSLFVISHSYRYRSKIHTAFLCYSPISTGTTEKYKLLSFCRRYNDAVQYRYIVHYTLILRKLNSCQDDDRSMCSARVLWDAFIKISVLLAASFAFLIHTFHPDILPPVIIFSIFFWHLSSSFIFLTSHLLSVFSLWILTLSLSYYYFDPDFSTYFISMTRTPSFLFISFSIIPAFLLFFSSFPSFFNVFNFRPFRKSVSTAQSLKYKFVHIITVFASA